MEVLQVNFGDFKVKTNQYPEAIQYPNGKILYKKGIGEYPYNCPQKDKYPDAMIYEGNGSWSSLLITA